MNSNQHKIGMIVSSLAVCEPSLFESAPRDETGSKLIVPVSMGSSVHDAMRLVRQFRQEALIVAIELLPEEKLIRIGQAKVAVKEAHPNDGDCHPLVSPSCTVGDIFKMMVPGSSITITDGYCRMGIATHARIKPAECLTWLITAV